VSGIFRSTVELLNLNLLMLSLDIVNFRTDLYVDFGLYSFLRH
jgi:hypothetical protein